MKFSDIVALAKAGYKPADVKELLDLCETDPETKKDPEPEKKGNEKEPEKKEQEKEPEEDIFEKLAKENN